MTHPEILKAERYGGQTEYYPTEEEQQRRRENEELRYELRRDKTN